MPREKIPYPCECGECGTSQKLKTINGAGPNSEGNISILGGEGVAVKTDTESHTVTLDVDTDSIVSVKHAENADTAAEAVHASTADTADEAVHASTADDAEYAKFDASGKTIMNTDGTQTVTGAKTFAGETTVTGKTGISGAVNVTGAVNANNVQNVIKVASHDSVLASEDVLNAADIMTVNGNANNIVHRFGNENVTGVKAGTWVGHLVFNGPDFTGNSKWIKLCKLSMTISNPDLITITKPANTWTPSASFFAVAHVGSGGGKEGNRTYSILNTQLWTNDVVIVSLINRSSWELWAKTARNYNYIEIRSLFGGVNASETGDVTEHDTLPQNATNIIYLLGSE